MESAIIFLLGGGLVSLSAYIYWDKRLRIKTCFACGARLRGHGKRFCKPCFKQHDEEPQLLREVVTKQ